MLDLKQRTGVKYKYDSLQQQAELFILEHIQNLLDEGNLLTIENDKITLWTTETTN